MILFFHFVKSEGLFNWNMNFKMNNWRYLVVNVWYVSYGSNICYERFLCYIMGNKPEGSQKTEKGCRDQTPPTAIETVIIPFPLYFAKERSKWGIGGVAFIDHQQNSAICTYGRRYLITDEQFFEIVAQENQVDQMTIDLERVIRKGAYTIHNGWYGRIVYLGLHAGEPMFTFTSNQPMDSTLLVPPSTNYLKTIARGLEEIGLKEKEVVSYLMKQSGIKEYFTSPQLLKKIYET